MESIIKYIGNIKGSPKTTIVGALLIGLSVFMYFTREGTVTEQSAEAVVFFIGLRLLFKQDVKNEKGTD